LTAREFEARLSALAQRRRRARSAALLAVVCAVLGAVTSLFMVAMEVSLAVGSTVGVVVAIANFAAYRETIAVLALDPSAYVIPEVSRYGGRFATATERARLAKSLEGVVRESTLPESWFLADRARCHAQQLESLATELACPHVSIRPASAVACRRLLTCGAESPLYNPKIPSNELDAVLMRIRLGIGYEGVDSIAPDELPRA
jgi:hypothetical protein